MVPSSNLRQESFSSRSQGSDGQTSQEALSVLIVGRPNVGKSSLFNRLIGHKRALVHNQAGVTRDLIRETLHWPGPLVGASGQDSEVSILLMDSAGLGHPDYHEEIQSRVEAALGSIDVVLMVFDAQEGFTPRDQEIYAWLRKKIPATATRVCVLNKVDQVEDKVLFDELSYIASDHEIQISAEHGFGVSEIKSLLVEIAQEKNKGITIGPKNDEVAISEEKRDGLESKCQHLIPGQSPERPIRVAIVGRPNVGKSTFFNALSGEATQITSSQAGTTTDAVNALIRLDELWIEIIDTAGIRRKSKTGAGLEVLSVIQSKKALEKADIALLLLDGSEGPTEQDEKIAGLVEESHCSVILLVNKWDLRKGKIKEKAAGAWIREQIGFLNYAPLVFISALKRGGIDQLSTLLLEVMKQRYEKIKTPELTRMIQSQLQRSNPKRAKIYTSHFIPASKKSWYCPKLVLQANDPKKIHFSLKRLLVNELRKSYGFMGTPIRVGIKKSGTWKHLNH